MSWPVVYLGKDHSSTTALHNYLVTLCAGIDPLQLGVVLHNYLVTFVPGWARCSSALCLSSFSLVVWLAWKQIALRPQGWDYPRALSVHVETCLILTWIVVVVYFHYEYVLQ